MRLTIPIVRPVSRATMLPALEALSQLNEELMETFAREHGREPRPLYSANVRYQPEPPGQEDWDTIAQVYPRGWGDCEDLAGIRVGELRRAGETSARADTYRSRTRPDGSAVWHAVVVRGDGTLEDPSAILGMRTHRGHAPEGIDWSEVMRGAMGQDAPDRLLLTAPELQAAFDRLAGYAHRGLDAPAFLAFGRDWDAARSCAARPEACSRATRARLSERLEQWVRAVTGLLPPAASSMGNYY